MVRKLELGDWLTEVVETPEAARLRMLEAAARTLNHLGYSYEGGEQWKPPLGPKPDFGLPKAWAVLNYTSDGRDYDIVELCLTYEQAYETAMRRARNMIRPRIEVRPLVFQSAPDTVAPVSPPPVNPVSNWACSRCGRHNHFTRRICVHCRAPSGPDQTPLNGVLPPPRQL